MDLSDRRLHHTIFPNVTLNVHGRGFWLFRHRRVLETYVGTAAARGV